MDIIFTRADLLTDISDKELTALSAPLVNTGDPDPVVSAIARAQAAVGRHTARYVLDAAALRGFVRDLAIYYLHPRLGDIPAKRQQAYDQTMRELAAIRDGRYPDLPQKDPLPPDVQSYEGRWGGEGKVEGRR